MNRNDSQHKHIYIYIYGVVSYYAYGYIVLLFKLTDAFNSANNVCNHNKRLELERSNALSCSRLCVATCLRNLQYRVADLN